MQGFGGAGGHVSLGLHVCIPWAPVIMVFVACQGVSMAVLFCINTCTALLCTCKNYAALLGHCVLLPARLLCTGTVVVIETC